MCRPFLTDIEMLDSKDLVSQIPLPPNEITLLQAAGLISQLAEQKTRQSMLQRLRIHDPVVRVWALEQLLKAAGRGDEVIQMGMHVARRSAHLRQLLLPHLIRSFRFDLVKRLQTMEEEAAPKTAPLHAQMLQATLANDYAAQVVLHERLYLLDGNRLHILEARDLARSRLGWRDAWKHYLRVFFTNTEPLQQAMLGCLRMFEREDAREQFVILAGLIKPLTTIKVAQVYAAAQQLFWDKKYEECLVLLRKGNILKETSEKSTLFSNLAAISAEKSGNYKMAATWYAKQASTLKNEKLQPSRFIAELDTRAKWAIGQLVEDTHPNYLIMTGFPRSGTTLLENVFASHPAIATCEETSSLIGSVQAAYQAPMAQDPERKRLNLRATFHRQLYYANLKRFISKPAATVVIDKTPIIGANIKYLQKIFPTKRYIFSIRHPYDVVLSNYKQDYQQNIAMAAFNDIHDACVLYDYVMRNWFEVFPGETDRVYYVKYDDLVNDFERVIRGALEFIGVPWTDEVNNFAQNSTQRAVRTPSYANVRKGLTIGVQTSWQNFEFLFDQRCRALLDPWAKRFGYQE